MDVPTSDLEHKPKSGEPGRKNDRWAPYLRRPQKGDAIGMRALVDATGVLDPNSTYAYLLMATDFAGTSIVAERDGEVHGFVTGYTPPERPDVLFVWQVGVAPSTQGTGLGGAMLDALVHRVRSERHGDPLLLEATVSPSNTSSRALFGAFARRHGVPLTEHPWFGAELLDADLSHEDEPILRIGPLVAPVSS